MNEFAGLQIRIDSKGVVQAVDGLENLAKAGGKAERATDGLTGAFSKMLGPLAGAVSAYASLEKLVGVTRQFDILSAGLQTATGSADNAAIAFEAIQDFATNTPYDLQQVTDSFTKLVNYGLTPSERALTAYGDTSAALGKDLNQLIEAVADAATGEFERLKEFGIKSSKQGDQVAFTFRGTTTTVKNSAKDIEEYLIKLGENNFAGNMAKRMATLDGAISNLGDEWNKLFLNISEAGAGDVIEESVRAAIDTLTELNTMLASGQLEAYIQGIADKFDGVGRDISETLDIISGLVTDAFNDMGVEGDDLTTFLSDAFGNMPENIRAFIQIMVTELAAFVDKTAAYGNEIVDNLYFWRDESYDLEAELRIIDKARESSISKILVERDEAVASFDAQVKKGDELRKKYDEIAAAKAKATGDRLAQFAIDSGSADVKTEAEKKAEEKLKKEREKALESLHADLRSEEDAVIASYEKRVAEIIKYTKEGTDEREILLEKAKDMQLDELDALEQAELAKLDSIKESLMTEEEALAASYEERKNIILENTAVTETERQELLKELNEKYLKDLQDMEAEKAKLMLSNGEELFGELSDLSKNFAGEQSGIYKTLFAASKAFAISESIIKIQQAIANAAATPFPANLAAMATVVSATAGIISTISGTNYSGAYDTGGYIPSGSVGLVGEIGPELVSGPANVTSRKDTAKLLKDAQTPAPTPVQNNVKIINTVDPAIVGEYLGTDDGSQLILNTIRKNPDVVRGLI